MKTTPPYEITKPRAKARPRVAMTCRGCGAGFSVKASHAGIRRCCSKACMGALQSVENKGEANPNWRGDKLLKKCTQCGAAFRTFWDTRRFCSRACFLVSDSNKCPEDRNGMRYASRVDENQEEIVSSLEAAGVSVFSAVNMRRGAPDLIASKDGETVFLEVKNPKTQYGKRGLNDLQEAFARSWFGRIYVVHTPAEALAVFGIGDGQCPPDVSAFGRISASDKWAAYKEFLSGCG